MGHVSVIGLSYGVLLVLSAIVVTSGNVLQDTVDVSRVKSILEDNLQSTDITSLYYAVRGLKSFNSKLVTCDKIISANYDKNNIEHIYYLTNAAEITGCVNKLKPELLRIPNQILEKKEVTIPELFYAVYSLKALGKGSTYDKEDGLKNLVQLLKKDDVPTNYGFIFQLCEHMGCNTWTTTHAAAVLGMADESDGRALHWEGGLAVTSQILTAIIRTHKSLKKTSPLTEEQRLKFAEYLLSRSTVTTAKGATLLLEAATVLADDEPTPICISIKGKKYITSEADTIEILISDLIQRPVKGLKPEEVIAQSGTRLADDVVVLSKQPLTQKPQDSTTYVLNLSKIKSQYGLYKIALTAGSKATSVNIAVLGQMHVQNVELGVGDVDGTTSPKTLVINHPNKVSEVVHADHMQKISLKFSVRDKANKLVTVQQAFVRIATAKDDEEVIFVAEPDGSKTYKVELNVGTLGKHFQGQSGLFSVTLYLGDSGISNPIHWPLGKVNFNFGQEAVTTGPPATLHGPLPEISHQFRVAEPRPARFVSDVFAALCAAPLLLLLVSWARVGVNFRQLPCSLSAPLFHLGLGGCLALYGVLWVQLSMFETLRYLAPLAALTFLAGHRLLRTLATNKTR